VVSGGEELTHVTNQTCGIKRGRINKCDHSDTLNVSSANVIVRF